MSGAGSEGRRDRGRVWGPCSGDSSRAAAPMKWTAPGELGPVRGQSVGPEGFVPGRGLLRAQ